MFPGAGGYEIPLEFPEIRLPAPGELPPIRLFVNDEPRNIHAAVAVTDRGCSGSISPYEVSLNNVAVADDFDAVSFISGNNVARGGSRSSDYII